MPIFKPSSLRVRYSPTSARSSLLGRSGRFHTPQWHPPRLYATEASQDTRSSSDSSTASTSPSESESIKDDITDAMPPNWEDDPNYNISAFSQLPNRHFGFNQHMVINAEFKEALRQVLWQFRAPIRYAFAYGSGVFPQSTKAPAVMPPSPHPHPPEAVTKWQSTGAKSIDFIFGVSYTQHWHSLNLNQHRDHYSFLGSLGSGVISRVQDQFGAGAYFNPYITVNGMSIKYGVVNLDTLYRDLSEWDTLYLAGRLQKPVKILRDDPRLRLANQVNLISALRAALLMLPAKFSERELYFKIAGLSYIGDPRMKFRAERPDKVYGIVDAQMTNFRQLYSPLITDLPNISFNDSQCMKKGWMTSADVNCQIEQDMDPKRRGNMVRRLPKQFRKKLYNTYKGVSPLPEKEFEGLMDDTKEDSTFTNRTGTEFDKKIAVSENVSKMVSEVVKKTVMWPTVTQSLKGILTAGPTNAVKYALEKRAKGKQKGPAQDQRQEQTQEATNNMHESGKK